LARALLSVRDHVKVYDQWRASVRVYRMPSPGSSSGSSAGSMNRYKQLLSSVPQERQSVPVVLHAMLEQVREWCMWFTAVGRSLLQPSGIMQSTPYVCLMSTLHNWAPLLHAA
jgi:hypothetical protein